MHFQGSAFAMSTDGMASVAAMLGAYAPERWTVLAVETSGCGFLPDRRPQILYERHFFHLQAVLGPDDEALYASLKIYPTGACLART